MRNTVLSKAFSNSLSHIPTFSRLLSFWRVIGAEEVDLGESLSLGCTLFCHPLELLHVRDHGLSGRMVIRVSPSCRWRFVHVHRMSRNLQQPGCTKQLVVSTATDLGSRTHSSRTLGRDVRIIDIVKSDSSMVDLMNQFWAVSELLSNNEWSKW